MQHNVLFFMLGLLAGLSATFLHAASVAGTLARASHMLKGLAKRKGIAPTRQAEYNRMASDIDYVLLREYTTSKSIVYKNDGAE